MKEADNAIYFISVVKTKIKLFQMVARLMHFRVTNGQHFVSCTQRLNVSRTFDLIFGSSISDKNLGPSESKFRETQS